MHGTIDFSPYQTIKFQYSLNLSNGTLAKAAACRNHISILPVHSGCCTCPPQKYDNAQNAHVNFFIWLFQLVVIVSHCKATWKEAVFKSKRTGLIICKDVATTSNYNVWQHDSSYCPGYVGWTSVYRKLSQRMSCSREPSFPPLYKHAPRHAVVW